MDQRAAVIVAGGRSSRMGSDKAALQLDGQSLLGHAVVACAGFGRVVVVGAPELAGLLVGLRAELTREVPPGGGPSAGIAAGLAVLPEAVQQVQLLACDLPQSASLVAALDAAAWSSEKALVPVDEQGWPQYLSGRYPAGLLRAAMAGEVGGRSVRRLLSAIPRREVAVDPEILRDVDDPEAARRVGIELPTGGATTA